MISPRSSGKPRKLRPPLLVRRVVGESMLPSMRPGRIVWGTGWYARVRSGDVVILHYQGRELIKRVDKVRDGELYVVGDNPVQSTDSRSFGWISLRCVRARVFRTAS